MLSSLPGFVLVLLKRCLMGVGVVKIFLRQIATPAPPFESIYVYTHPVRFFLKIRGFV